MTRVSSLRWPVVLALLLTLSAAQVNAQEVLKPDMEKVLKLSQSPQSNPFSSVLKQQPIAATPTAAPGQAEAQARELSPELFLEMVDLQHMNPQEASAAFSCMSSEIGQVVAQEGSRRVIVFDTRENLQRIVTAIKTADQPIQALLVKAVDLQHVDAKVAASVLAETASGAGSVVAAAKTNTLILSDTKASVEAMLKELETLDRPTAGLLVETFTLRHLDAKSAQPALESLLSEFGSVTVIERTNALVVADLAKNMSAIRAEIERIDKEMLGLVIETVNLKFLTADNLKPVLEKMVSQYGVVSTNVESNSVIVCDTEYNMPRILAEIRKADRTPEQIMVEVVMLDVRLGDDQEIGINWDLMSDNHFYDYIYRQNLTTDRVQSTVENSTNIGTATAFNSVGALGGDFSVISGTIRHVVHLLQEKRDVEIIACPRALVRSGKTTNVQAIEEIPYTEQSSFSEGGNLTSTEFKPVGITLDVTANITEKDIIALDISINLNVRTSESSGGVPVVDTRSQSTTLLLGDGQIVVMGGLRRNEKTVQATQIPLLGDLPIVGHLFKHTQNVTENSELVILISPHIYDGDPVPAAVMEKFEDLKENAPLTGPSGATARAKAKAEEKARAKEAKLAAAAEARAKAEAEAQARANARAQARAQAEAKAKARAEAQAQARANAQAQARVQAEAKAKAEAEARAQAELEAKIRAEAEAKIRAAKAQARAQGRTKHNDGKMTVSFTAEDQTEG